MDIKFSRHAKRRAKLYRISEEMIREILLRKRLREGDQEILEEVEGFKYPIKIVVSVKEDIITVITCYPLKRSRRKNESLL